MDFPECITLKEKYYQCLGDLKAGKIPLHKLQGVCDNPFEDYRDCVTVLMRLKISKDKESTKN